MSVRKNNLVDNENYHIYNRGNSKQKIFHDKEDFFRFMSLLYSCNSENNFRVVALGNKSAYEFIRGKQIISIGAYCIMPNHFHLIITQHGEGNISKFIQKVTTAYVMYYNKKYKHSGSLFEGKFKSEHIDNDRYLKYLFSYIHLNPVKLIKNDWKEKGINDKKKTIEYLNNYHYSSFLDYVDIKRSQNKILNRENFPNYFPKNETFLREIFEWLNYNSN